MKCPHISSQLFCLIKVGEDVILVLILIIGFIVVDLIANDLCVAAIRAKDVIAYRLIGSAIAVEGRISDGGIRIAIAVIRCIAYDLNVTACR